MIVETDDGSSVVFRKGREPEVRPAAGPAYPVIEHKYIDLRPFRAQGGSLAGFWNALQDLEKEGWELCGFEFGCAFFKRLARDPQKTTCILTGAEGENPDDCTTHEHE